MIYFSQADAERPVGTFQEGQGLAHSDHNRNAFNRKLSAIQAGTALCDGHTLDLLNRTGIPVQTFRGSVCGAKEKPAHGACALA